MGHKNMKREFLTLFLTLFFLTFVTAAVNENNYFKLGEIDSDMNLVRTSESVSGVNIRGFICSDSDCSGSLGDLWGGELYTSSSMINLVYPTVLKSSYGYGFWMYKEGYNPYWAKGVDWAGSGNAPAINNYLGKQRVCFSDVSVVGALVDGNELSFDAEFESPFVKKYGSIYLPSEIVSHLRVLVDVDVEVLDDNGVVVWSDSDDEYVGYSEDGSVSFSASLDDGDYTLKVYTSLENEDKCLDYDSDMDSFDFDVSTYNNDKDDDGYTEDVDCDDYDASVWRILSGYVDGDLDGHGVGSSSDICSGNSLSVGYSSNSDDCNDDDAYLWEVASGYKDWDGDGHGVGSLVDYCAGAHMPFGYVDSDDDCDDGDSVVWQFLNGYRDADEDSKSVGSVQSICSGNNLPSGYDSILGNDCDDSDANVWQILSGYFDKDGDNYGVDPVLGVCAGGALSSIYSSVSGDCDDNKVNVNPGVLEVCGDGVDNNCDGDVDEGCNSVPSIFVSADPLSGIFPLTVSFNCQGTGGDGVLSYFWDFGNGDSSIVQNPSYIYLSAGNFDASCKVRDADGDEVFAHVGIEVGAQSLEVEELVCFDEVVEGHNQSCSVYVEDSLGGSAGGVDVEVFYSDGSLFGSCLTDDITGACGVKDLQMSEGNFEVYVVVSKSGYVPDDDGEPKFVYDVLGEEYRIVGLSVYNDSGFSYGDYDFFRGEGLFVSFVVEDLIGNVVSDDLILDVNLVSSTAGGRVALERVDKIGSVYRYKLIPVPVTHDFLGDSNVFAFVFDIVSGAGGQEEVSLIIRNNLPFISPTIPSRDVRDEKTIRFNLSLYENDVEDSGNDLRWEVVSSENGVNVNLVGKILFVKGKSEGDADIVLRLFDLDGDYDEQVLVVEVEDDDDDSGCSSRWRCSDWSDCSGGFEDRVCIDEAGCYSSSRPVEIRECSVRDLSLGSSGLIEFGGASYSGKKSFSIWWIVFWLLLLLLLLVLVLLLFSRK